MGAKETPMKHLTPGQHAWLEAELLARRASLTQRLALILGGRTRVEHAHELLEQDAHDASQRAGEREIDLAMSDLETVEIAAVDQALLRLKGGRYGTCASCGDEVPFDRLKVEPWALRCVPCEAERERRSA
jgi:DnaK suppressor protein